MGSLPHIISRITRSFGKKNLVNLPTTEEIMEFIQQDKFCSRLEDIANILLGGNEPGMEISRLPGTQDYLFSNIETGTEREAPSPQFPYGNVSILSLHGHPRSPIPNVVTPGLLDLAPAMIYERYEAVVGFTENSDLGLVIYKTIDDFSDRTRANHGKKKARIRINKKHQMCRDIQYPTKSGSIQQTQQQVITTLLTYYPFAQFISYRKSDGKYVPN